MEAFSIAFIMAFLTISIPYTLFAFLEAFIPSVPTPQYKSSNTSESSILLFILLNICSQI